MASTTMGVKLDDEMRERLKALGERKRRSTHRLMKEAIGGYVERERQLTFERCNPEDPAPPPDCNRLRTPATPTVSTAAPTPIPNHGCCP